MECDNGKLGNSISDVVRTINDIQVLNISVKLSSDGLPFFQGNLPSGGSLGTAAEQNFNVLDPGCVRLKFRSSVGVPMYQLPADMWHSQNREERSNWTIAANILAR